LAVVMVFSMVERKVALMVELLIDMKEIVLADKLAGVMDFLQVA
jgi:hypothetical protein